IELLLDGGNEKLVLAYDANDAYLAMRLGGDQNEWEPNICTLSVLDREKAIANISYASAATDTGWVMEVRVPWVNVDVVPANGKNIGFNVYASDADGRFSGTTPQRDISRSWAWSTEGNGWQNPSVFGTLTFTGGPGGTVANATFTTDPTTRVIIGEDIAFDASGSTAPGEIVTYQWDFGDGTTGSGVQVTHAYQSAGRYVVTLFVEDADGAQGSFQRAVTAWDGVGLPENPLEIPMAATAPVIDGNAEDVWSGAQRVVIGTRTNGTDPDNADDLSADARLLWDANGLYVLFDVTDDNLFNDSGDSWQDDTPEVYLDGLHERAAAYDGNDGQYEFSWGSDVITGANPGVTGADYAYVTKAGDVGYVLEASLPWSLVSLSSPAVGTTIGLELMINDDDDGDLTRESKIGWFAPEGVDNAFSNPSSFGSAILVAEIVAAEPGAEIPGSFAIESVYPNPFNPTATAILQVRQAGKYEISVHDVLGRRVLLEEVHASAPGTMQFALDLQDRASGVYVVTMRSVATNAVVHATALLLK
ncbi:MAG TPA: sugar-binding protein, partial [Rhodothermales bacterium]